MRMVTIILYKMQFKQNKNISKHKAKTKKHHKPNTLNLLSSSRVTDKNTLRMTVQL